MSEQLGYFLTLFGRGQKRSRVYLSCSSDGNSEEAEELPACAVGTRYAGYIDAVVKTLTGRHIVHVVQQQDNRQ